MLRQVSRLRPLASASAARAFSTAAEASTGGSGKLYGLLATAALGGGAYYAYDQGLFSGAELKAPILPGKGEPKHDYAAVKRAIEDQLEHDDYDDGSYAPILIRLAWHSSGSYSKKDNKGGSNGATMRLVPESDYGGNAGLKVARDFLEPVKAKFPWISYADLYTLSGVVGVEAMGGPEVEWQEGRTDKTDGTLCEPDGRLPDGAKGAQHIRDVFYRMGFDDREIVALSGAHAVGRCHADRSGFEGPWTNSPITFSNQYFVLLKDEKWLKNKLPSGILQYKDKTSGALMMLPTDMALIWDKKFKPIVLEYAADEEAFFRDFAKAFAKLLELGVPRTLTGAPNPKPAPA